MSWMDDLKVRVEQASENITSDIKSYIQARVVDPVVKVGEPAKGNLSQAQIQAGAVGENQNSVVKPSQNVIQATANYMPLIILGIAATFILMKKSRG